MIFNGTKGNDVFDESADTSSDTFNLQRGGEDTVIAGSGDDIINMGAALDAGDRLNGGAGRDTVTLNGDYSAGITFADQTIQNIETLKLGAGFDYKITTADGNVAAGASLVINGVSLGAGNHLTFDGSAETDGYLLVYGGAGDDTLTGGAKADSFHIDNGGNDTVHGGGGSDIIVAGAALTAADTIDGGTGNDTLELNGDYSGGLVFAATTMTNVETLKLDAGHSYTLLTDDANVAAGATLTVDGSALGAGDQLALDGSAETDGHFAVTGGAGDDTLVIASGVAMHGTSFNGGAGSDALFLIGDNQTYTLGATAMTSVETLAVTGDFTHITTNDANVASGATLTVDLSQADFVVFNGSAEVNGNFHFISGMQNETITGGFGADTFDMTQADGGGSLAAFGNFGNDTFVFGANFGDSAAVNGGFGTDTIELNGDYSGGDTFASYAMTGIEILKLDDGNSYDLTTNNANVAAGQTLVVDASALTGSNTLTFNGAAETNGFFDIFGGDGDDTINLGAHYSGGDLIDGGAGNDTLELRGNYSSTIALNNVETLKLDDGFNYNFTYVSGGGPIETLTVDASALTGSHSLTFDGSGDLGQVDFLGGAGNDTFVGSNNGSTFTGGLGADSLTGKGGSNDIFVYNSVAESSGAGHYDTILDNGNGQFDLAGAHTIANVSEVAGSVSSTTFDADIQSAAGVVLGPENAAIVVVNGGNLIGDIFLVVDVNGDGQYVAGQDYVFDVTHYQGTITTTSFI